MFGLLTLQNRYVIAPPPFFSNDFCIMLFDYSVTVLGFWLVGWLLPWRMGERYLWAMGIFRVSDDKKELSYVGKYCLTVCGSRYNVPSKR